MQLTNYQRNFGATATMSGNEPFADQMRAAKPEIIAELKRAGFVLFSGAGVDQQAFETLVDEFFVSDSAAHLSLHGPASREVFVGRPYLGLHAEQKYVPWAPDLIAFYCAQPASEGGRTTVADGLQFIDELSQISREYFSALRLSFTTQYHPKRWREMLRIETAEELPRALDYPDVDYQLLENDQLRITYRVFGIEKTRYQQKDAFVNTIIHAFDDPWFYNMMMEDGRPIPRPIQTELREIAEKLTVPIPWEAGDFAIIDNSRVMHGREAYTDPNRLIRAKHGMARFS